MVKEIIKSVFNAVGYKIVPTGYPPDIKRETDFVEIYEACKTYTRVPVDSSYVLYRAVQYIVRNQIPGDFVECGVWRGGQAMIIAKTLLKERDTQRKIWLYDTFEGMSEPQEVDVQIGSGLKGIDWWKKVYVGGYRKNYFVATLEEVQANMRATGYPADKVEFVKGKVEESIPRTMPSQLSLARLDTDWYESTFHELTQLYPILSKNGVLIVDDYGKWEGSRKAVDNYFQEKKQTILFVRTPPGVVTGIKI